MKVQVSTTWVLVTDMCAARCSQQGRHGTAATRNFSVGWPGKEGKKSSGPSETVTFYCYLYYLKET